MFEDFTDEHAADENGGRDRTGLYHRYGDAGYHLHRGGLCGNRADGVYRCGHGGGINLSDLEGFPEPGRRFNVPVRSELARVKTGK